MNIRATETEMTSAEFPVYAELVAPGQWRIGPVEFFGAMCRERLFTVNQAMSAMTLGELVYGGRDADPARYDVLYAIYSGELGLYPGSGSAWERHDDPEMGR
ncbi:hypothetical protein [Kribbella sp. NBC_00889]|jgi:hypothetical protein|uniref:hypothetical protein n=1 Tax=Kribbella sp. NBC_00889 TaxID=2975974 RepID=UPI0038684839|nr:hypothetical protein OG817_23965 [Kribbella sp. NBC_00889]